jgi:hypothetical protein
MSREQISQGKRFGNRRTMLLETYWVLKILQDDQVTSAPRNVRVSIRTAV